MIIIFKLSIQLENFKHKIKLIIFQMFLITYKNGPDWYIFLDFFKDNVFQMLI